MKEEQIITIEQRRMITRKKVALGFEHLLMFGEIIDFLDKSKLVVVLPLGESYKTERWEDIDRDEKLSLLKYCKVLKVFSAPPEFPPWDHSYCLYVVLY